MGHAVKLLEVVAYIAFPILSPEILGLTKWGHWLIQSHCNSGLREQWIEPPTLQWVWGQFNSASHIIPPSYSHIRDTVLQFYNLQLSFVFITFVKLWLSQSILIFSLSGFIQKEILYITFVTMDISKVSYCSILLLVIIYNLYLIWTNINNFIKIQFIVIFILFEQHLRAKIGSEESENTK